ncbi:hypothetical protein HFN89_01570 [Rhizobium laguerreae]|nr:hypothetical protein [Rhizobium laguerreae]
MRVTIEHPAIVSGIWEPGGEERHDLVRIPTEFDIPEFSETDAPLAFEDDRSGRVVRMLDGKLFRAWPDAGSLRETFSEGGSLRRAMFVGGMDFAPLSSIALDSVRAFKNANPFANVENTGRRDVSASDRRRGYDGPSLICLRTPLFRNWRWLSIDTDERIEKWRGIAREFMGNFAIISDRPYLRCFEPCYVLEKVGASNAKVRQGTTRIYAKEVHRKWTYGRGLEIMGEDALLSGAHFFSATDHQGALALADQMGWQVSATDPIIEVLNADAVQTDFLEMETARHAMMLLAAAQGDRDSDPLVRDLVDAVIDWQDDKAGYAAMASAFHALRETRLPDVSEETSRLKQQITAFLRREEGAPIRINATTYGLPS